MLVSIRLPVTVTRGMRICRFINWNAMMCGVLRQSDIFDVAVLPPAPEVFSPESLQRSLLLIDCLSRKLRFKFGLGAIMRASVRACVCQKRSCHITRTIILYCVLIYIFFTLYTFYNIKIIENLNFYAKIT